MTREKAIEVLEYARNYDGMDYGAPSIALDMAISALREQDENMLVDAVGSNGEWMDEDFRCGNITHWMSIPEPPKGE